MGCSEPFSREAAKIRSSCEDKLKSLLGILSTTVGLPSVMVPVLSSTMVSSLAAFSRASLLLNKIPFSAPLPVPAIMAVGVASPNAHGQAITRTATILIIDGTNSPVTAHQIPKVITAIMITAGTNIAATLSARAWMGALLPWASWTSRMI